MKPFDQTGAFRISDDHGGLRQAAVRSAGVTVVAQGAMFLLQIGSTMLLARLLTPDDFGIVTMVTTFSLLLMSFGQNGFNEATLLRDDLDHSLASNMFWILVGIGAMLAAGFAATGPLLAHFYHDPRVAPVASIMGIAIFLGNTSVIHLALLKRAMLFTQFSINDIVARSLSLFVSIVLAWTGWNYWALVAGAITYPLAASIGAWILCQWVPGWPRRLSGTRSSPIGFVANVYGRYIVTYFGRNVDNLLVGWRFGPIALGFYKKAYDLFVMPVSQLLYPACDVSICTLSRVQRDSNKQKHYFLQGLSVISLVGMAISTDLTLVGRDIIRIILGPGWQQAGRIFTAFGPGIGVMMIYHTAGLLHLSNGRADRWFRWGIIEFCATGLLFLAALRFGALGIATAWTISFFLLMLPCFWYAGKPIELSVSAVVGAIWKSLLAGLAAGSASYIIAGYLPFPREISGALLAAIRVIGITGLVLITYVSAIVVLHRGCAPFHQVFALLFDALHRERTSKFKPNKKVSVSSETALV